MIPHRNRQVCLPLLRAAKILIDDNQKTNENPAV